MTENRRSLSGDGLSPDAFSKMLAYEEEIRFPQDTGAQLEIMISNASLNTP